MDEHTPRDLMLGGIIFVFFIVAGMSLINLYSASYGTVIDETQYSNFQAFNKTGDLMAANSSFTNSIDRLEEAADEDNPIFAAFGVAGALLEGAWATLSNMVGSFGFITSAIGGLSQNFGVPSYIIVTLSMIITTLILFMIYSLIFNRKV